MKKERVRLKDHYKKWRSTDERKAWYSQYRKDRYNKVKTKARNDCRKLERMPCEICGDSIVEAHHDDYSKPLEVRWLCQSHHKQWHAENGEGLNG